MMTKLLLRIVSVLLILHGVATFVAAKLLPLSAIHDRLLFAEHGFPFIFIALLNLAIWQPASRRSFMRATVHACNLAFMLLYLVISFQVPEPPMYTAVALLGALFVIGLVLERSARSTTSAALASAQAR